MTDVPASGCILPGLTYTLFAICSLNLNDEV